MDTSGYWLILVDTCGICNIVRAIIALFWCSIKFYCIVLYCIVLVNFGGY